MVPERHPPPDFFFFLKAGVKTVKVIKSIGPLIKVKPIYCDNLVPVYGAGEVGQLEGEDHLPAHRVI